MKKTNLMGKELQSKNALFLLSYSGGTESTKKDVVLMFKLLITKGTPSVITELIDGESKGWISDSLGRFAQCDIRKAKRDERGHLIMSMPNITDRLISIFLKKNGSMKAKTNIDNKEVWIRKIEVIWNGSILEIPIVKVLGIHNGASVCKKIDLDWANIIGL